MAFWGNLEGTLKTLFSIGKGTDKVELRSNLGVLEGKDYGGAWTPIIGSGGVTPDATTTVKGKLKLAGDLAGTADLPTVPALANKANSSDVYTKTQSDNNYEPKNSNIQAHISNTSNPHGVTKAQVGLSDVPNVDTTNPANITQSASYRFVTDTEKSAWNAKTDKGIFSPVFNGSDLTKDVDVTAFGKDARDCSIQFLDTANERIYCTIKATTATNVRIETGIPLPAGTYKLVIIG